MPKQKQKSAPPSITPKTEKKPEKKREPQTPWPVKQHTLVWVSGIFVVALIGVWWLASTQLTDAWKGIEQWVNLGFVKTIGIDGDAADTDEPIEHARLLDGVIVESGAEAQTPYAIMIENLYTVRPQSGLGSASVVYEALVEGGATRFMAVFDPSTEVPTIMPVRSARPYYLEWALEYNALYGHAGGSPKAITVIWEQHVRDLDALTGRGAKYYWRDTSRGAPHNLVTSSEKMTEALHTLELDQQPATFVPWVFKDGAPLEERGDDAKTLSFNFSYGTTYKVDWTYHQSDNTYYRFNANQPHLDANTGDQITADTVIVQLTEEPVLDGGKGRLEIFVGGTGDAWVARDGHMIQATWRKDSNQDRTRYYDLDGNEIELNRGHTWVHVLTKTQDVTYE